MTTSPIVPYEVPPADRDLLECGHVIVSDGQPPKDARYLVIRASQQPKRRYSQCGEWFWRTWSSKQRRRGIWFCGDVCRKKREAAERAQHRRIELRQKAERRAARQRALRAVKRCLREHTRPLQCEACRSLATRIRRVGSARPLAACPRHVEAVTRMMPSKKNEWLATIPPELVVRVCIERCGMQPDSWSYL